MTAARVAVLVLAGVCPALAVETGKVKASAGEWTGTPVLGWLAAGQAELRPVLGIPGASRQGEALTLPESAVRAHLAPLSRWALLEMEDGSLRVLDLSTGKTSLLSSDRRGAVVFSPSGTAVAVVDAAGQAAVFSGLPDNPKARLQDAAMGLVAVSDDGDALLLAGESALALVAGGEIEILPGLQAPASFLPGARDVTAAGAGARSIWLYRSGARLLASGSDGIGAVDMLAPSADGRLVFFAASGGSKVWRADIESGRLDAFETGVEADGLRAAGEGVFLFSARPGAPAWLFGARSAEVFFVPGRAEE